MPTADNGGHDAEVYIYNPQPQTIVFHPADTGQSDTLSFLASTS